MNKWLGFQTEVSQLHMYDTRNIYFIAYWNIFVYDSFFGVQYSFFFQQWSVYQ